MPSDNEVMVLIYETVQKQLNQIKDTRVVIQSLASRAAELESTVKSINSGAMDWAQRISALENTVAGMNKRVGEQLHKLSGKGAAPEDCIEIKNLIVFANHGVLKEEKTMGQKFVISLSLYADMSKAAGTDDLKDALNYAEVCEFVTEFTKKNRCKLIEAAAENIADALLICYPMLSRVDITINKPWAPIGLPLDGVAAHLSRSRTRAYISIGSNMGDKKGYLDMAVNELSGSGVCTVKKVSQYIVTKPVGNVKQDDFLNACIEIETVLDPARLLELLHSIEDKAGRERTEKWGPRTLDMDILLYGDSVIFTDDLIIPHPEMTKREFALSTLAEIAPYAYHPIESEYAINLLKRLRDNDNA